MEFVMGLIVGGIAGMSTIIVFLCFLPEKDSAGSNPQININVNNREERHYTLNNCFLFPKVVYRHPYSLALITNWGGSYFTTQYIEGHDEMKLLRASLNDIAKVDKYI